MYTPGAERNSSSIANGCLSTGVHLTTLLPRERGREDILSIDIYRNRHVTALDSYTHISPIHGRTVSHLKYNVGSYAS